MYGYMAYVIEYMQGKIKLRNDTAVIPGFVVFLYFRRSKFMEGEYIRPGKNSP